MADDLPLATDEVRRRLALPPDRQYGIDPGPGNDRGYAFNQWLPVSTNKVGSGSWVQQGADPKLAVPEIAQGGLLGVAGMADAPRTGKLTPEALGSLLTGSTLGGGLLAPRGSLAAGGSIKAYHGSPHDFDKFGFDKIGTGEGAQAYGHGLYFAGNEEVARSYKRAGDYASRQVDVINGQLSQLAREMDQYHGGQYGKYTDPKGYELKAQYDALMQKRSDLGHMYEVNINADPAKFIQWDKPLSEQHPVVQQALSSVNSSEPVAAPLQRGFRNELFGGDLVGLPKAAPDEVSKTLAGRGVPGIQYLDQGSRGSSGGELIGINKTDDGFKARIRVENRTGTGFQTPTTMFTDSMPFKTEAEAAQWANDKIKGGTSNYVVFPTQDEIIQILRKYGLAAPSPAVPSPQGPAPKPPGLLSDQQSEVPMQDRVY